MKYVGGYYKIPQALIKTAAHRHTASDDDPVSEVMIDALNCVQAVPWSVNIWVLDVMRQAWEAGDVIGDIPSPHDVPLPARLPEDVWSSLSKAEKMQHKAKMSNIHGENARLIGKRQAFQRKLHVAEELRDEPAIWFPHSLDFRGRIYPLPQDLNPQGDDIAKALLQFAEAKPLGERGLFWLRIRLANTYGMDKLTFEERVSWVFQNEREILESAWQPLEGRRFWTGADEPWSFLATCRDYALGFAYGLHYPSRLPVNLDATASGIQHLSAMGLDPIGARATNLTMEDSRYDLYAEVASAVNVIVARDAAQGNEAALHWAGKVDRKTVKRAVMTTPYGVTPIGIRDQLISDKFTESTADANYLRDAITEGLDTTVAPAKRIMAYFQEVALVLAKANIPLRWTTPAGMTVIQAYYNTTERRVRTLFGEACLWLEGKDLGLNARKQMLASAPNIIHSFDAAHLARTVLLTAEAGVSSFSFIHDSYGTHACDVDALAVILREQFVEIYSRDRLEMFETEVRAYAPDVTLPERPQRGTFDLEAVLNAPYFFS